MTFYYPLEFIFLKMTISIPPNSEISTTVVYNRCFSRFGTHFDDRPKMLTFCVFERHFYLRHCYFEEALPTIHLSGTIITLGGHLQ